MNTDTKIPIKLIAGLVAIVVILGGLYIFVFSGDDGASSSTLQVASSSKATGVAEGTESLVDTELILQRLNELRQIKISIEFFNSPTFLSLQDFGVTINPQLIGRDNPFIPSTYVPDGNTIVPRANPAILYPINGSNDGGEAADSLDAQSDTSSSDQDTSTSSSGVDLSTSTASTSADSQPVGS
jgi:hypothetical protein